MRERSIGELNHVNLKSKLSSPKRINFHSINNAKKEIFNEKKHVSYGLDEVPPLLDLSFESNFDSYDKRDLKEKNRQKGSEFSESLYINEEPETLTTENRTKSFNDHDNEFIDGLFNEKGNNRNGKKEKKDPIYEGQNERTSFLSIQDHKEDDMKEKNFQNKQLSTMTNLTLETYKQIFDSNSHSSGFDKYESTEELLANLLSNPSKLQRYLSHLVEESLKIKKSKFINNQYMDINFNGKQKHVSVNQLLANLLCKIGKSSAPSVITRKEGEISFNFGSESAGENGQITNIISENEKRILELNKKLAQQEELAEYIKQEYDSVINNYAATIQNINKVETGPPNILNFPNIQDTPTKRKRKESVLTKSREKHKLNSQKDIGKTEKHLENIERNLKLIETDPKEENKTSSKREKIGEFVNFL